MPVKYKNSTSGGGGGGTITGGGSSGQVAFFNGPSAIAGDTNFTYAPLTGVGLAGSLDVAGDHVTIAVIADPTTAPTATLVNTPGNIEVDNFDYLVTFISFNNLETLNGPISSQVTVTDSAVAGQISLTGIAVSPSKNIASRKIYRRSGSTSFGLLTTIANNTATTFTDNIATASMPGDALPFQNSTGALTVSSTSNFTGRTHFTQNIDAAGGGSFGGGSTFIYANLSQMPNLQIIPTVSETYGLKIFPLVGVAYTGNLLEIHDLHASTTTLQAKFDENGHLVSGDNASTITSGNSLANIDITSLQPGATYAIRTALTCMSKFGDHIEFGTGSVPPAPLSTVFSMGQENSMNLFAHFANGSGFRFYGDGVKVAEIRQNAVLTLDQKIQNSNGNVWLIKATGAAHTALPASTEKSDLIFDLNRTVQWAGGDLATQRATVFFEPHYGATSASVFSDVATVAIANAPQPDANMTFTRAMALWVQAGTSRFDGRILGFSATVASANDLTLGAANQNLITGTTQINAITTTGWSAGSTVTLIFSGIALVKHNTSGGAGTAKIFLSGSIDYVSAANGVLTLEYDGTQWQEKSRKIA